VPPSVRKLEVSDRVGEKLGRRGISAAEAEQLPGNQHGFGKNPRAPRDSAQQFLVGETNGGRWLDLVVEPTHDPAVWIVITGWESDRRRVR
jgi:hypothetical protein